MEQLPKDQRLTTVDVERRGYGRRYSWLPVDMLNRTGFVIDCTGGYMRPEQFDLRTGDLVRWEDGTRRLQAYVTEVVREGPLLRVAFGEASVLPPDFFAP